MELWKLGASSIKPVTSAGKGSIPSAVGWECWPISQGNPGVPSPSDQGFFIADMSIFGHCPAHDDFYLVVCNHCSQVVKPQAFQKHCGEGSPREKTEGSGAGWEVKCVMEEGTGDRKVLGVGGGFGELWQVGVTV